jgi:hypothetical protein
MRKLLEIEINDEIKKSMLTSYAFSFLTFALFLLTRISEKSFFEIGFFIELVFVVGVLRFYARAHRNRNYALWGVSLVISVYLLMNILHFTFVQYNIFILYIAFLAALFLGISSYVMSSPLYFPRVQWWEYDFRYRGDLKATANINDEAKEIRVEDLRRECISFLSFNKIRLGEKITIDIPFGDKLYTVNGQLKTAREDIPGRPIRYGLKLIVVDERDKKSVTELKKVWMMHKKANIRRKFADYKEANEA